MRPPVFSTLGCRLNAYETEAMKELAAAHGVEGAVVVNTCAVTAEAVRKAKQEIRRLARENPGAPVIVTGCAAQTEPETFAAMPEVSRVIGNHEKMQPETWIGLQAPDLIGETERVMVDDIMSVKETAGHLIDGFGRHRAYVQVQNGCDHRCTFCIIPYGRGNSRSVPAGVVVEQIRRLVDKGFAEVVLTGVDLTSWGADLPGEPRLGDLVMLAPIRHSLNQLEQRHAEGPDAAREFSAPFLCTTVDGGRMLNGRMALLSDAAGAVTGYLVTLVDVSDDLALLAHGDGVRRALTRDLRGMVGNLRAAAETMVDYPAMAAERRAEFERVVLDESRRISDKIDELGVEIRGHMLGRWPMADIHASDLARCVAQDLAESGIRASTATS